MKRDEAIDQLPLGGSFHVLAPVPERLVTAPGLAR